MPPFRYSRANRACDSCKRRKVKCDTAEPCANCRVSDLSCQYTSLPKKRGPKVVHTTNATHNAGPQVSNIGDPMLQHHAPVDEHLQWEGEGLVSPQDDMDLREHLTSCEAVWQPTKAATTPDTGQSPVSAERPSNIYNNLLALTSSGLPSTPLVEVVTYCIDLFMQYTFPTTPIIHEPTLRIGVSNLFSRTSQIGLFDADEEQEKVTRMRAFTLIAAVCSSVASTMPESLLPYRYVIAWPFLQASREMLKVYEDYDLEYPDSTSLSIRILHSTSLQSMTGKTGASRHVLGQAALIAQTLHLYSERAIQRYSPVEAQVLRLSFWHLYSSDKAAASLRNRPYILDELLFNEKITLQQCGQAYVPLLDTSNSSYEKDFEEHLLLGFHFVPRLWVSSAAILQAMRTLDLSARNKDASRSELGQAYLKLTGIMDELPHWLQASNLMASHNDDVGTTFSKTSFWVQRCNVMTTFHCVKLVILQQCIDSGLCSVLGLNDSPFSLAMKKVEMANEFLQILDDVPFLYHKVKGEPSVERIRVVGTILLELVQNVDNEAIKVRANSYFTRLLDMLAKLNSKASDELSSGKT